LSSDQRMIQAPTQVGGSARLQSAQGDSRASFLARRDGSRCCLSRGPISRSRPGAPRSLCSAPGASGQKGGTPHPLARRCRTRLRSGRQAVARASRRPPSRACARREVTVVQAPWVEKAPRMGSSSTLVPNGRRRRRGREACNGAGSGEDDALPVRGRRSAAHQPQRGWTGVSPVASCGGLAGAAGSIDVVSHDGTASRRPSDRARRGT
jgi:hypothetical protein